MEKNKLLNLGLIVGALISLISIGGCYAPEGAEGGFDPTFIIILVLFFGMLYFLMIRPQRKRQKEHKQLIEELKKGDRVVTAGGIFGVIENVSEDSVVIKVESGATMRVAKSSVALKRER
ncbi:MAG: preprotein translocase subunit YajC [Dehalococcoidia bacterium]|nr:preprotein translocase subunit YajC [Dehalococcoidia bacterium]